MKYCPLIEGKLDTSTVGVGQIGAWRMTQLDYVSSNEGVLADMKAEDPFQPELHDFFVTEISRGTHV